MKTIYLFLFILLSWGLPLAAQTLSPEQLKSDFVFFKKALKQIHPQMYRYTSKPVFDSLFAVTEAKLNQPMSGHEFYKTMVPLVAALKDGHIKWFPSDRDEHYPFFTEHLFPLKLYFMGEQAWIIGNYGNSDLPAGARILSINNKPLADVINTLLPNMTFADGNTINGKYSDLNNFFSGYYATYYGPSTQFEIIYADGTGEKKAVLPAVSEKIIKDFKEKHKPSYQKPFRLTFHENQTAVITIERFWDNKKEQAYKAFLKTSFQQLKQKQIQHLVLDIRGNEGGNEPFGVELYTYLAKQPFRYYDHIKVAQKEKITVPVWKPKVYNIMRKLYVKKSENGYVFTKSRGLKEEKPKKNAFQGELYVLINGSSFSVTTEFSARVHADNRATFIGEETGGGYRTNSSGVFAIGKLPNSQIVMGIPMLGFRMANVPDHIAHEQGIIPDYTIVPTIQDKLLHKDPVMEYTFELIQSKTSLNKPAAGVIQNK